MWRLLGGFGLLAGASYPWRTLGIFKNKPYLWGYLIVPFLLNLILGLFLYGGLLFFGWQGVEQLTANLSQWLESLIANLPTWLGLLEYLIVGLGWLLRLLLVVGLLLLTGFVLTQFGVLLGSPWYGQLSQELEKIRTGRTYTLEVGMFTDLWRAILFELKKLALMAIAALLLLLLNLVPGIGTLVVTVGGLCLTLTIVCLDFFDPPLERRRLRFRDKLKLVWTSLPASAGFSFVCLVLSGIPLLNLLTIPLCVAGGTLFFCDRILPYHLAERSRSNQ